MSWDDGDKGKSWRSDRNKGPTDLDAVVRDLQRKLAHWLRGGNGNANGAHGGSPALSGALLGAGAVLLLGIWGLTGIYVVDAAERGVVLRFGAYQATTLPGLRWHLPWPIERVERINIGETVGWSYQGSMLTRDENIVNVNLEVQFRRTDPQAYLFNMRDPEVTLHLVTASAIREVVGKNELDFILTDGRTEIAEQAQVLLQETLDAYGAGITVYGVNLQEAQFPREVEISVQDAIKAREDRERRILKAEEYRNEILPQARGEAARRREEAEAYRARVIADAEGEADRFLQILTQYQAAPEVTRERLYLETLEEVLSNSTKVLVNTEGGNNLLYLPLDQLRTRPRTVPVSEPATTAGSASISSAVPVRNPRERQAR